MNRYEGYEDLPHVNAILEESPTHLLLGLDDGRQLEVKQGRKAVLFPEWVGEVPPALILDWDRGSQQGETSLPLWPGLFEELQAAFKRHSKGECWQFA